ncbi:MFS transporter [Bombilactobacillus bombi]|uniref:MFS transporter n=1 Tax=Bombilactobacillus bombi TaxID=1303590 RepID=UPI0015E60E9C|nr:MFS transporter [Bombilactobacillus bombi]MBA1435165.1 MFS transporter [Bombilactobacillus bombi]
MSRKKALIIIIMAVGTFFCMLDTTIMTIVLPEIQSGLNVSLDSLSWAVNLYTIIFATLTILFSRLAEIRGKNKYFIIGLILFTVGSILSGMSNNLSFLLFGRVVQSFGAATILPLAMTISLAQVTVEERNKIVALLGGAQGFAAALGPTIGGMIAQYYGWRWVFYINVPFLLLTIIVAPFVLPIKQETKLSEKIDLLGSILSMVMLFSLTLTLIKGNSWGWSSSTIIGLILTAIVSFILFIITELKVSEPMINLTLFKSRNFNGASLSLILCNFFLGGFAITMPTFLVKTQSKSELHAALLMTPY